MAGFVHLHVHTQYSILDGAIRLKKLCREIAKREIDAVVIVVDRLGHMHHAHFVLDVRVFLIFVQFIGGLERIVTTDRNQRIDAQTSQTHIGSAQRRGLFGIVQICGAVHHFAGICSCRTNDNATAITAANHLAQGQHFRGIPPIGDRYLNY